MLKSSRVKARKRLRRLRVIRKNRYSKQFLQQLNADGLKSFGMIDSMSITRGIAGAKDPLSFGNCAWKPELILSPSLLSEIIVQPKYPTEGYLKQHPECLEVKGE